MTAALLVGAVLVAAAVCPVMMWLQARRGQRASCCVPPRADTTLDELRRRRAELDAAIASTPPDAA